MEITEEFLDSIAIDVPAEDLDNLASYAEFCDVKHDEMDEKDLKQLMGLLKEQAACTLREVQRLRGEKPVAIHVWKNPGPKLAKHFAPMKPEHDRIGWTAWTDRKRHTLEPL